MMKLNNLYNRKLGLAIFIGLVILCTGCDPSYKERQAQEKAERKEQLRKKQEEEKREIVEMEARFNAVYFPPQNIGDTSFTYEIQKFFEVHSGNNIIFKGYLKDIETTEDNIIYVEFLCPIGNYLLTETAICFRLAVPESKLDQFSEAKHSNLMPRRFQFLFMSDYFVVSEINKIQRVRKYKFDGTANGEEVEIETEVSRGIVALGQLIEAVATTKEEGSTNKGGELIKGTETTIRTKDPASRVRVLRDKLIDNNITEEEIEEYKTLIGE